MDEEGNEQTDEERPTVRIPKYQRGDEVVAWSEVDAEWWEHVQHVREVHNDVVETYLDEPGVQYIERGRGNETIAGKSTSTIVVLVIDEAAAEALNIPDKIDGIPVNVEVDYISDSR